MSFSGSSSSSSVTVTNLIEKWKNNPIASCVLGLSKIGKASYLSYKISHSAILLLQKEIDYDQDDESEIQNSDGIIIEYGDYNPNMSKKEKGLWENGSVIYRYGEQGGLRYYVKKYSEFIEEFADVGYVDLNIDVNNQKSFDFFINEVAPTYEKKWIQENYSGINDFNCQTFSIHALKQLKPYFNSGNIYPKEQNLANKKSKQKLAFIPSNIKDELMKYYRK